MGRQHRRRGTVGENQHWQKKTVVHWEGLFGKSQNYCSRTEYVRVLILKTLFPQKLSDVSFTNPTSTVRLGPTSNISKATWRCSSRRIVQNSVTDCSKLVRVHSKKDCGCTWGRTWSNTILIKKRVQFLQCFQYFVQLLHVNILHIFMLLILPTHKTQNKPRHLCLGWDSKQRSHRSSERRQFIHTSDRAAKVMGDS
jgi:hypothetical protein